MEGDLAGVPVASNAVPVVAPNDATSKDLERFLRARGFSRREAKSLMFGGWKTFERFVREADNETPGAKVDSHKGRDIGSTS